MSEGLDEDGGAVRLQQASHLVGGRLQIEVVKDVTADDEIEGMFGQARVVRVGDEEIHPIRHSLRLGLLGRGLDPPVGNVDARHAGGAAPDELDGESTGAAAVVKYDLVLRVVVVVNVIGAIEGTNGPRDPFAGPGVARGARVEELLLPLRG